MSQTLLAIISAVLGILAFWLAAWGEDHAFNVFPIQFIVAVLAVVLGGWVLRSASSIKGMYVAKGLSYIGMISGGIWLLMIGLLYLLWPK